jgi:hypothetical protein
MKLSRILFKPKWQDKDAATRAAAVAADADPELVAALPELTRSDPDARVRLAALKRLGDYERWRERSTADADADVRAKARTVYMTLLCSASPAIPALPRLISELDTLSPAELEAVATTAATRDLRAAALSRVMRPALLIERAMSDPDATLRLAALDRVNDPAALERIAERTRKSDKTISRHARERVESMRIGAGDTGAIAVRARILCERIEALLRNPGADPEGTRATIEKEWASLGDVPEQLSTRFRGASAVLQRLLSPAPVAAPAEPVHIAPETTAAPAASQAEAPPAVPSDDGGAMVAEARDLEAGMAAASRARFDAALAAAAEQSRRERDREREHRDATLRQIEQLAQRSETLLDAGDTGAAQSAYAELRKLLESPVGRSERVEHALAKLHARFAELKGWQHWSNQRRRRALCDEIEALAAAGLHPDAVASRVQEARVEWQRLDATEGHGNVESGLTRHFFAACQRALKPARAYFDKRDALRDTHRTELEALLARAASVPVGDSDWKALTALRRDLASGLRGVDALNPRDRHNFARRIKDAIAAVTPRIEGHARDVESAKARLIAQAQALSAQTEQRGAARVARELQQQWTALGEGARSTDQKQWREFRAACDRVFETLDADRKQREAQSAAQLDQARTLVSEAEAVLADPSIPADALQARRRELESRWHECAATDRSLDQRFRQLASAIADRARQQVRNQHQAHYTTALEKSALLQKLEGGALATDDVESQWKAMGVASEFDAALDRRFEQARGGLLETADADALAAARDILVQLEFVAGVASPADDRERRMNYQVSRLSARMRGGSSANPDRELTELFVRWFALPGGLPQDLEQRFALAARAALSTLP